MRAKPPRTCGIGSASRADCIRRSPPARSQRIHKHSGGVPRLVNVIAERALLGGYAHDSLTIEARDIDRAAREALAPKRREPHPLRWAAAASLVLAGVGAWFFWPRTPPADARATPVAQSGRREARGPRSRRSNPIPVPDARGRCTRRARARRSMRRTCPRGRRCSRSGNRSPMRRSRATCPPAIEPGLYCLRGTASLDKLFAQGRPALLRLRANRASTWALLLGADAVRARVRLGNDTFDIERVALQNAWTGEYAALWRGPETLVDAPSPDGRGPAVDWVHAHLPDLHRSRDARRGDARRRARLPAIARACRRWRHRAGNAARAFRARPRPPTSHAPWTERPCR